MNLIPLPTFCACCLVLSRRRRTPRAVGCQSPVRHWRRVKVRQHGGFLLRFIVPLFLVVLHQRVSLLICSAIFSPAIVYSFSFCLHRWISGFCCFGSPPPATFFSWVPLTFLLYFLLSNCMWLLVSAPSVSLCSVPPVYTAELKVLWVAVGVGLDSCR